MPYMHHFYFPLLFPIFLLILTSSALAQSKLSLSDYLNEVKEGNENYKAAIQASQGAKQHAIEGDFLFSWNLFGTAQYAYDAAPPKFSPSLLGTKTEQHIYSLGLSKQFPFGLQSKIGYYLTHTFLTGTDPNLVKRTTFFDAKPQLELSQPLWRNWLAKESENLANALTFQALGKSHTESFTAKQIQTEAEVLYWQLAVTRDLLHVQKQSRQRALKIRNWNAERVRLNLADRVDLIQSDAALKLRELELQTTVDEERVLSQNFNAGRGKLDSLVLEELVSLFSENILPLSSLSRSKIDRDDVQALYYLKQAAQANAIVAEEKLRPNWELFGTLALNGRKEDLSPSLSDSFGTDKPTLGIGVRMTTPLDFSNRDQVSQGYRKEALATEQRWKRKVFEQERDWVDLNKRFQEAMHRLSLSKEIEKIQEKKFENEKERHHQGRSTAYFVLQFEQDWATSQINRLKLTAEVLIIYAKLKLLGNEF